MRGLHDLLGSRLIHSGDREVERDRQTKPPLPFALLPTLPTTPMSSSPTVAFLLRAAWMTAFAKQAA